MKVVLAGLLLIACVGCGGDDNPGEDFRMYHLEAAIGAPGADGELHCGPPRLVCPGVVRQPPPHVYRYAVTGAPALTGDSIVRSTARHSTDPEAGTPLVLVDLTAKGTAAFARLTWEVARVGDRDQAWHHVALVVGDEIVAFPEIDFDAFPDGIADAHAVQIQVVDDADARELVRRIRGEEAG